LTTGGGCRVDLDRLFQSSAGCPADEANGRDVANEGPSSARRSLASRARRAALIFLESANGRPSSLALLWTASKGRFNTTEARAGEMPLSTSERNNAICSAVQLRDVTRAMRVTPELNYDPSAEARHVKTNVAFRLLALRQ